MNEILAIALLFVVAFAMFAIYDTHTKIKAIARSLESLHEKVGTLLMRSGGVD